MRMKRTPTWSTTGYAQRINYTWITVKAPNILHLSILTSVGYNKKETNLKQFHS